MPKFTLAHPIRLPLLGDLYIWPPSPDPPELDENLQRGLQPNHLTQETLASVTGLVVRRVDDQLEVFGDRTMSYFPHPNQKALTGRVSLGKKRILVLATRVQILLPNGVTGTFHVLMQQP